MQPSPTCNALPRDKLHAPFLPKTCDGYESIYPPTSWNALPPEPQGNPRNMGITVDPMVPRIHKPLGQYWKHMVDALLVRNNIGLSCVSCKSPTSVPPALLKQTEEHVCRGCSDSPKCISQSTPLGAPPSRSRHSRIKPDISGAVGRLSNDSLGQDQITEQHSGV
jgi:hypothetical protein